MKKVLLFFAFIAGFTFQLQKATAQGCSDAGACTLHSFIADDMESEDNPENFLRMGLTNGGADFDINVFNAYLDYRRILADKWSATVRITAMTQNGEIANSIGLSDIYITSSYDLSGIAKVTAGLKVPLNDASAYEEGRPLPMDYQTSLGTYDIILGASKTFGDLNLSLIYQQPLSQNSNEFLASEYPPNSPAREYPETNHFQRAADVLLRASYDIRLSDNIVLTAGLLPIYHLENDRYTNEIGEEVEIDGSQGLTLNTNLFLKYIVDNRNSLDLVFGAPVLVRDTRPDGLTRAYVAGFQYNFSF